MKVFSVYGVSDSGKTSSVEAVIRELRRRGYSVGTVKDIHFEDFRMDQPGTDTFRHSHAGAELVVARGLRETDYLYSGRQSLAQVLIQFDQDYVILEGVNEFAGPGILTAERPVDLENRLRGTVFAITGRISREMAEYQGLPVINALTETPRLVDLIEQKVPDWWGQPGWLE